MLDRAASAVAWPVIPESVFSRTTTTSQFIGLRPVRAESNNDSWRWHRQVSSERMRGLQLGILIPLAFGGSRPLLRPCARLLRSGIRCNQLMHLARQARSNLESPRCAELIRFSFAVCVPGLAVRSL